MTSEKKSPVAEVSDAEWEVMRIVWAKQGANGRFIIEGLHEKLNWNESTTKTLIRRLVDKGYLKSRKEAGVNFYEAELSEESCNLLLADKLIGRICNTLVGDFIGKLIDRYELSIEDIQNLKSTLETKSGFNEIICNCTPCQCAHCKVEEANHVHR
ncbi:MAG: BlaI/MecI/CopY family transcriptional regulator [Clostridiaceae bacterium]|mgnify:CR=1 FL=1